MQRNRFTSIVSLAAIVVLAVACFSAPNAAAKDVFNWRAQN